MKALKGIAALFGITLIASLLGCGTGNSSSNGVIEKLQKEVPYTIVTPKYLPRDMEAYPSRIGGPIKDPHFEDAVRISLTYYQKEGNNEIIIDEENAEINATPSGNFSAFLSINGINVLEEIANLQIPGTNLINGFYYGWNQNGVHLTVRILGYDRDECRKVIESMIK